MSLRLKSEWAVSKAKTMTGARKTARREAREFQKEKEDAAKCKIVYFQAFENAGGGGGATI